MARPAIIAANTRSGGTFLARCLSNHPDVFCTRREVLHSNNIWRGAMGDQFVKIVKLALSQRDYQVSMCKLTYSQLGNVESVRKHLREIQPRVVWLRRKNVLRQGISVILLKMGNNNTINRPAHTTKALPPLRVTLNPKQVCGQAHGMAKRDRRFDKRLHKWFSQMLPVTYEEITANADDSGTSTALAPRAGRKICRFLDVPYMEMPTHFVRVNPQPLSEMIENWDEVRAAVAESPVAHCLEMEAIHG